MEEIQAKSEALLIKNPEEKAKLVARAGAHVQQAIAAARVLKSTGDLEFAAWLAQQPVVTITSPGKPVTINRDGVIQSVLEDEVIRIRNKKWVLPPGIPVDVPKPVAEEFFARQKIRQETLERKKILNANAPMDNTVMARKWNEINQKFGSQTDFMQSEDRG